MIEYNIWRFKKKHKTPLYYAAKKNSIEIGELLISKGAAINIFPIFLQTILIRFE